jgi:hypothetical protein
VIRHEKKRRHLRQLWPVAMAVLAACGGASEPAESTATADDAAATTTEMESAEGRRRSGWVYCAGEGATCAVPSTRVVRYGANGTYFYKTVSGSISCNNATWGDPLVGILKKCDYSAVSTTAAPGPAPAPTPVPAPAPAPVVRIAWTASTNPNVVGYRIYYGVAPKTYLQALGNGVSAGSVTTFQSPALEMGRTYYFSVTAIDGGGDESDYSNEVSKLAQ